MAENLVYSPPRFHFPANQRVEMASTCGTLATPLALAQPFNYFGVGTSTYLRLPSPCINYASSSSSSLPLVLSLQLFGILCLLAYGAFDLKQTRFGGLHSFLFCFPRPCLIQRLPIPQYEKGLCKRNQRAFIRLIYA